MTIISTMPKYEAYKDSGVEWLGDIPAEWSLKPGLVAFTENKRNNKGMKKSVVLSLSYGAIIIKPEEKLVGLVPESFETYQLVEPSDIIIRSTDLQNDKTSLRTGLAIDKGIITSAYINLKVDRSFESRFLHYYLHSLDTTKVIYKFGSGLRQNLSFLDFKRLPIFDIPKSTQTAIANYLDKKTTLIDEAIVIKEKQISLLKERKQIIIQKAVTQGLNPKVPMKDSGVEWIGSIPEHWQLIATKFVSDIRDGTHDTPIYIEESDNSRFLITSKDFIEGNIDFSEAKNISIKDHKEICKRSLVDENDVLMSMIGGNIGKSVIVGKVTDFSIKNVALFKTGGDESLAKYIQYYLLSGLLEKQLTIKSRGGAQPFMSLTDVRNLVFFKLPDNEKKSIVKQLDYKSKKIDKSVEVTVEQIEKLKEYKATLINSAVIGKIKVV